MPAFLPRAIPWNNFTIICVQCRQQGDPYWEEMP